jgi:NAD(P)-dependent dehydrogenase (short-subunit alcohol dehydrogenase family)
VLVTGASRGIGWAVVRKLAEQGARVAAVGRDAAALESAAAADPSRIVPIPADLGDEAARSRLVEQCASALGGLDGLVSSAGIVRYAKVGGIAEQDAEAQWKINVLAPLMLSQAAAEWMRGQGGGAIVHVASTLAMKPAPATSVYAATKGAVLSMTRSLAAELAADGICVNAVAPGVVDTDMIRVARLEPGEAEPTGAEREQRIADQLDQLRGEHPLGRLGRPEDVARAVLYLLDATWTTGSVLPVDGGMQVG